MTICLTVVNGYLTPMNPQPDSYRECSLVLQSGSEVLSSPFHMTIPEAQALGTAIVVVWGTAAVIKKVSHRLFS